ncbi:MAG: hypothetical protein R3F29_07560 [Planctomycetota bacterium]
MEAAAAVDLARSLVARAVTADLQRTDASADEQAQLAAAPTPVTDPLAQRYMAWRRAVLWVAAVMLSLGVLVALVDHRSTAEQAVIAAANGQELGAAEFAQNVQQIEQSLGVDNLSIIDGLQVFLLLVKIGTAALVVWAALRWTRVRQSRSLARWGWLLALVLPLIVSAWPWGQALDFSHLDGRFGVSGKMVQQQVSVAIGTVLLATIAPKLLALFPGIMRSSLTLKTLLPQASAPGWLTVVFAPFLAGFLMLVLSFLSQVQGSWVLIAGVLLLIAGPYLYVRNARELVRPHSPEEVGEAVGGLRRRAGLFSVAGATLLVLYLLSVDGLSWSTVLHLLLEAGGGIMLTMVAISDFTLALLAYSHRQGAEFHASAQRELYERRLEALAGAGLTDVDLTLRVPVEAA